MTRSPLKPTALAFLLAVVPFASRTVSAEEAVPQFEKPASRIAIAGPGDALSFLAGYLPSQVLLDQTLPDRGVGFVLRDPLRFTRFNLDAHEEPSFSLRFFYERPLSKSVLAYSYGPQRKTLHRGKVYAEAGLRVPLFDQAKFELAGAAKAAPKDRDDQKGAGPKRKLEVGAFAQFTYEF